MNARREVVVDTNVFGAQVMDRGRPRVHAYAPVLAGYEVLVSSMTVAEISPAATSSSSWRRAFYGAKLARWGEKRREDMFSLFRNVRVVYPGPTAVVAYVALRSNCHRAGHGLAGSVHEADRWIAATAISLDAPLVSSDRIFRRVPGLTVLAPG